MAIRTFGISDEESEAFSCGQELDQPWNVCSRHPKDWSDTYNARFADYHLVKISVQGLTALSSRLAKTYSIGAAEMDGLGPRPQIDGSP